MTLEEKYHALLADLLTERKAAEGDTVWSMRLDEKIADLRASIEEKFGHNAGPEHYCPTCKLKALWAPGSPKNDMANDDNSVK